MFVSVLLAVACDRKQPSQESPPAAPRTTAASAPSSAPSASAATPPADTAPSRKPPPPTPETRLTPGGKRVVSGKFGVVTSVEDQATRAGVDMLERGGNAVDAAVATAFALAVTHPSAGNIGGGGFLLARLGNTTEAVDFRETAPSPLTRDAFDQMIERRGRGPVAVGVPGSVRGLELAHQRHGKLPWKVVLEPAIRLAEKGHRVGGRQAKTIQWSWPELRKDETGRAAFTDPKTGTFAKAGATLRRPRLATALKRIAERGSAGFYEGETASDLVETLGGAMTLDDLKSYRAKLREPLRLVYRGYEVETMPPPSAGGVALMQMLAMLQKLESFEQPADSAEYFHLIAETGRRAQAERRFHVFDPDRMGDAELERRRARWISPDTWLDPHPIATGKKTPSEGLHDLYEGAMRELEHTTHFSVIDRDGGVVACTMTLSASFGAKLLSRKTGIVLNNSVASFGSVGENQPQAGKRTTSSMAPTLVLSRGRPVLVLGTPGGDTIPSTVTQVLTRIVDYGMPLDAAIDGPRIHQGFVPDELGYEWRRPIPDPIKRALQKMGHRVVPSRSTIGDANDAMLWDGTAYAYADPREEGLALAASAPNAEKPSASATPAPHAN